VFATQNQGLTESLIGMKEVDKSNQLTAIRGFQTELLNIKENGFFTFR